MRRLALPVATLVAFTGLTAITAPGDPARASDSPTQPTDAECLSTMPQLTRGTVLASTDGVVQTERKVDGRVTTALRAATSQYSGLSAMASPQAATGADLAAVTSAQLIGTGPESIVRFSGSAGTAPTLVVDTYRPVSFRVDDPTSLTPPDDSPTSTTIGGFAPADDVAVAADTFKRAPAQDWQTRPEMVTDPDQLAVAWRSPTASDGSSSINVRLYESSADGRSLLPYSSTFTASGAFSSTIVRGVPADISQRLLAVTTGDLDFDGDPEVVLAYQLGGNSPVRVDVLNVNVPAPPTGTTTQDPVTLTRAAAATFALPDITDAQGGPPGVSTIDVDTGLFGGHTTQVALGWQTIDPQLPDSAAPHNLAQAEVRTLSLPHADDQKPVQLTHSTGLSGPTPLTTTGSQAFLTTTADTWRSPDFAMAVGDVSAQVLRPDQGQTVFTNGKDEVVVAYADGTGVTTAVLDPMTAGLDTEVTAAAAPTSDGVGSRGVSLGVGDTDMDGDDDIALGYAGAGAERILRQYSVSDDRDRLELRDTAFPSLGAGAGSPLPIVMANLFDQSLRMVARRDKKFGPICVDTVMPTMVNAADSAPFWGTEGHMNWWGSTSSSNGSNTTVNRENSATATNSDSLSVESGVEVSIYGGLVETQWAITQQTSYDRSHSDGSTSQRSVDVTSGMTNVGSTPDMQYSLLNYRCWYYFGTEYRIPINLSSRTCAVVPNAEPTIHLTSADDWETQDDNGTGLSTSRDDYAWAPFRNEWTSLTRTLPASAATQSGGGPSAGLAIDGIRAGSTPATVSTTGPRSDPWWQVKLNSSIHRVGGVIDVDPLTSAPTTAPEPPEVGLVRIFQGSGPPPSCTPTCDDSLRDFDVYVFNDDTLANATNAELAQLAARDNPTVARFHGTGYAGKVTNFVTRAAVSHASAAGRYVRVAMDSPSADLQLAEVEVYPADDRQSPPEYPCSVGSASAAQKAALAIRLNAAGDGSNLRVFNVGLWDPSTGTCVNNLVDGILEPMNPAPAWIGIGAGGMSCDGLIDQSWTRGAAQGLTHSTSTGWTLGVGVKSDATVAMAAGTPPWSTIASLSWLSQIKWKGSREYQHTWGWNSSSSQSTTIGKDFSIQWSRGNYCKRNAAGKAMPGTYTTSDSCEYRFRPFYYTQEEWSNTGYQQLFPHVSYVVEMTKPGDYTDCIRDHWRSGDNIAPVLGPIGVTADTAPISIDPLDAATDKNTEDAGSQSEPSYLVIRGVSPTRDTSPTGSLNTPVGARATVENGKITYTPPTGSWDQDMFFVTISDHALQTTAQVTVSNRNRYSGGPTNGQFDDGLTGWTSAGSPGWSGIVGDTAPSFASALVPYYGGASILSQAFAVPTTGSANLAVSRRVTPQNGINDCNGAILSPIDALSVSITPAGGKEKTLDYVTNRDSTPCLWKAARYDLSAYRGQVVTLRFTAAGAADGYATRFSVDAIAFR